MTDSALKVMQDAQLEPSPWTEDNVQELWEEYMEEHKHFCIGGDARDYYPEWNKSVDYLPKAMAELTLEAEEAIKELSMKAEDIENAASEHQLSMQRHEGGSDYHAAYAAYQRLLGI